MIIINGKPYSQGNTKIVNGQVVSRSQDTIILKFNEKRTEEAREIEKIEIDGMATNINISASNSSKIEIYFYGQVETDKLQAKEKAHLITKRVRGTLKIKVEIPENLICSELSLSVKVPRKVFKAICAKASSGNITFGDKVLMKHLKLRTTAGNIQTNAIFTNANISSMSGNASICVDAKENVSLKVETMSGDVSIKFENVSYLDLEVNTKSGTVKNTHSEKRGHVAYVDVTTMSGNVTVK